MQIDPQRLGTTLQQIGSAIVQSQTVEDALGTYLALIHDLSEEAGRVEAESVLSAYASKTLGALLVAAKKKEAFPDDLVARLERFKNDRNWLVHRSRSAQRRALASDDDLALFCTKVDSITDSAHALYTEIVDQIIQQQVQSGRAKDEIEANAKRIFADWHKREDEIGDVNSMAGRRGVCVVEGTVRDLGSTYVDGTPKREIHVPIERARGLPFVLGTRVSIELRVGQATYEGGLRSTPENRYVWISPDIIGSKGERLSLGKVLTDFGLASNDRVHIRVDGTNLEVVSVSHISMDHNGRSGASPS